MRIATTSGAEKHGRPHAAADNFSLGPRVVHLARKQHYRRLSDSSPPWLAISDSSAERRWLRFDEVDRARASAGAEGEMGWLAMDGETLRTGTGP